MLDVKRTASSGWLQPPPSGRRLRCCFGVRGEHRTGRRIAGSRMFHRERGPPPNPSEAPSFSTCLTLRLDSTIHELLPAAGHEPPYRRTARPVGCFCPRALSLCPSLPRLAGANGSVQPEGRGAAAAPGSAAAGTPRGELGRQTLQRVRGRGNSIAAFGEAGGAHTANTHPSIFEKTLEGPSKHTDFG